MIAGRLEIEMAADLARLRKDMGEAKGTIGRFATDVARMLDGVKSAFASLGLTAGVGGLFLIGKEAINALDKLGDLSKTTRIAAADLAGLGFAARQSGADLDATAGVINKLAVNMGKDSEKFRMLGVSAKDPIEAFKQLADATNALEDPQQRAAVLAEALGKGWERAAPLLAEGSAKIGEMVEEGRRLSGVNAELVRHADEFNDKLVKLAGNGGSVNAVLAQMLPLLNATADGILANGKSSTVWESIGKALAEVLRTIVVLGGNVAFVLRGIGTEIGGLAAQAAAVAVGDFSRAAEIGRQMKADAAANRVAFDEWEKSIMAVGAAMKSTTQALDAGDQVTRRLTQDAAAAARAFMEAEKLRREAEERRKKAAADAVKARIDHAEAELKAEEMFQQDYKEAWAAVDAQRTKKYAEESKRRIEHAEAELKAEEMFAQDYAEAWKFANAFILNEEKKKNDALLAQLDVWDDLGDRVGQFFGDLVSGGRNAFDSLKRMVKSFAAEMIALFAKRWILQLGAGAIGGGAGEALAGSGMLGPGSSLAGSALNFLGLGSAGVPAAGGFGAAATAAIDSFLIGNGMASLAGGAFTSILGTVGAALPILLPIALLAAAFFKKGGGPKDEGQFTGIFGADGRLTGTAGSAFNIVGTSANPAAQEFATGMAGMFVQTLASLGITPQAFQLGVGIVRDPKGTAPTFVDTVLRDAAGRELFRAHNDQVGRSDDELKAELELQSMRALLAAVKASNLPPMMAAIFNDLAADASLEQIKGALAEAQRLQGLWAAFQDMFATDAERLAEAQRIVAEGFRAIGMEVPSVEEFRAAVRAAWEGGDTALFEALMKLAPAFKLVADSMQEAEEAARQAAAALLSSFQSAAAQINPAWGSGLARSRLESAAGAWGSHVGFGGSIQDIIDFVGGGGSPDEAWSFAQSLGGDAPRLISELYQAYAAWQSTVGTTTTSISDLGSAAGGIADALDNTRERLQQGIRDWITAQRLSPESPLDPLSRLGLARSEVERIFGLAQGGDLDALGQFTGAADAYKQILREAFGSSSSFVDGFNWLMKMGEQLGGANPAAAESDRRRQEETDRRLQFQESQRQTGVLTDVYSVLISIRDQANANAGAVVDAVTSTRTAPTEPSRR